MRWLRPKTLGVAILFGCGCATLADGEPGLDNAPSSRAGPFRLFRLGEVGEDRVAPFLMDDQDQRLRDPAVLDVDGDPTTYAIEGYFGGVPAGGEVLAPTSRIVRAFADDGRSFDRSSEVVLESTLAWEGGTIGSPSVILSGGTRRLYYAGAGGIGLAESVDGGPFVAREVPIIDATTVPWADGPPRSPGVTKLPNDEYVMFFEADRGGAPVIGRADSEDGIVWFVDTTGPVIVRGPAGSLDEHYVGTPEPVVGTSAEKRDILYVYYAARGADDKQLITMAAAFFDEEGGRVLEKSPSAMYAPSTGIDPREPAVVRFDTFSVFLVTQWRTKDHAELVVPGGVAPATAKLPPIE
ncbi:MAG: hypothetical protein HOV80_35365 [Polyangiaceae bacterium]|nr:hypothetical protein [Polyangiaceae bacterium]